MTVAGKRREGDVLIWFYGATAAEVILHGASADTPHARLAALDAHAARLGLSRSEYVRRRLAQDAATSGSPVSVEDLARFAGTFADLAHPDVMSQAWT